MYVYMHNTTSFTEYLVNVYKKFATSIYTLQTARFHLAEPSLQPYSIEKGDL